MSREPHDAHRREDDPTPDGDGGSVGRGNGDGEPDGPGTQPEDIHGVPDATLGGYLDTHDRPPAFEGADGHPYTVSPEVEQTPDLRAPYVGYLVFPRWAATGLGIIGHVQTPVLCRERRRTGAEGYLRELPLDRLKTLLDDGIARRGEEASGEPRPDPFSFGTE